MASFVASDLPAGRPSVMLLRSAARSESDRSSSMAYPRQRPAGPPPRPLVPMQAIVSLGIVLLAGGIFFVLANINAPKEESKAAVEDKPSPFEGLPPEVFDDKPRSVGSGAPQFARAATVPAALADHADWDEAHRIVAEAQALEEQWHQAQRDGDTAAMQEHGRAARARYEDAVELMAGWVDRFLEDPGEADPEVQRFLFETGKWRKKMMEHRKLFSG